MPQARLCRDKKSDTTPVGRSLMAAFLGRYLVFMVFAASVLLAPEPGPRPSPGHGPGPGPAFAPNRQASVENAQKALQFIAPGAGSYVLQRIQTMPSGDVLNSDGRRLQLPKLVSGRVTLLGFMYTYCSDPYGCPLAYLAFMDVRQHLLADGALARHVQLISLSFDPTHDTPDAMALYAGPLAAHDAAVRWYFLTTASVADLRPIVDGLGQSVRVQRDGNGRPTRFYDHMLKVFLIDASGIVREIYSTAYLQPEVIVNDIKTLLAEPISDAKPALRRR